MSYGNRHLVPKSGQLLAPEVDYILLDGSGSMATKWDVTLAGLDNYFNVLRSANMQSHGILNVFDSVNIERIQRDSVISDWAAISPATVDFPGGGTPLYDAVNVMVRYLAELAPAKCSIIIVTDGQAGGRQQTNLTQARALLDWCRAQGWQVVFLGADFNNSDQALELGSDKAQFISVQKGRVDEAGELLGNKRLRYSRTGDDIGFTGDEKSEFGGYLAGPSK